MQFTVNNWGWQRSNFFDFYDFCDLAFLAFVCFADAFMLAAVDSIVLLVLVALWLAMWLSYALFTGCNMVGVINTCLFKVSLSYYVASWYGTSFSFQ